LIDLELLRTSLLLQLDPYILPVKQCFKPSFVPVVTTTFIPSNIQFLFDAVVLAQHGGVRYDITSYTVYLIGAENCNVAVLHTADSCHTFPNVTNRRTDRQTVYTRGIVTRPSDIVLSAICLSSVV